MTMNEKEIKDNLITVVESQLGSVRRRIADMEERQRLLQDSIDEAYKEAFVLEVDLKELNHGHQ